LEGLVNGGEHPFGAGHDQSHMSQLAGNRAVAFELNDVCQLCL
jgi:hypothetical protein